MEQIISSHSFLAPSGAQEMLISVCLSNEHLSRANNLYLSLSALLAESLKHFVLLRKTNCSHLDSKPDLTAVVLVLADDLPVLTPGLVLPLVRQRDALLAPGGAVTSICNEDRHTRYKAHL